LLNDIGLASELKIIKTQGDRIQHLSFDKLEGKGFFTKEIEEALLNGETDLAVHSHKDLPTEQPAGLVIAAVSGREDPSERLLIRKEAVDPRKKFSLKKHARVGTSAARRKAQLLSFRPDVQVEDLRGNVPTRVQKLRDGQYDAILMAAAGLERLELDLSDLHVEQLDPTEFVPAPAQGVLALQIRAGDHELQRALQALHHPDVQACIALEREVLRLFEGGCHMPVGAYAVPSEEEGRYRLIASRAETAEHSPVGIFIESKHPETMAVLAVHRIRNIVPQRVFVSRDLSAESYLRRVLEARGFTVDGRALIETNPVPIGALPDSEWIFFSSKQAVQHFFRQRPEVGKRRFGCVGKSTAEALRKFGHRADFIGGSTDTKLTGKQFAARVGDDRVLFPQAKGSLRSVQQQLVRKGQAIDLVVYETILRNESPVESASIYVFTSPSNVEAFFDKNSLPAAARIVAMGHATRSALREQGITHPVMPDAFDEAGLSRAVFGLSAKA
jgi:hydroxymethylbilane synthase